MMFSQCIYENARCMETAEEVPPIGLGHKSDGFLFLASNFNRERNHN